MKEEAMGVDVQEIVGQLVKSAAEDPDSLKQFGVDPAAAIKGATGLDLSEEQVADVVKAVEPLLEGKELNLDAIHDTVHEMARDEARHGKALKGLLDRYFG